MMFHYVYGWFECLGLVLLCLALLGVTWRIAPIITAATILCIGVAIVRSFSVAIGVNTVVAVVLLSLLLSWLFSRPLAKTLVAASCSMLVVVSYEFIITLVISQFTDVVTNPKVWLLVGIPHVLLLFGLSLFVRGRNLTIFAGSKP